MAYFVIHDTPLGGGTDGIYLYVKPLLALGETTLIDLDRAGVFYAFTLASLQIDYLKPARLDDLLDVVTRIGELKRASVVFEQWLQRAGSDQVLARLSARAACVDATTFRPKSLPAGFRGV